jgi:hypothetical protein
LPGSVALTQNAPRVSLEHRKVRVSLLISTLRAQHRSIRALAAEITAAHGAGRTELVRERMRELSEAVRTHLELEDTELYPILLDAAEDQAEPEVVAAARSFALNMRQLTGQIRQFLERYLGNPMGPSFGDDWSRVMQALNARINAEELSLYRVYERLAKVALPPDRRRAVRIRCEGTGVAMGQRPVSGAIRDLSLQGMYLQTASTPLELGSEFQLQLQLAGSSDRLQAVATVRHRHHGEGAQEWGMGLEFLWIEPNARARLAEHLSSARGVGP